MKALAVADGEGRNGVWLARQGLDVISFDVSPRAVAKSKALAGKYGVSLDARVCDFDSFDWPEAEMDLVVGIFVQVVEGDARRRLFDRMKSALKPGGLVLLIGYGPDQLRLKTGGPGRLENLYTEDLLREAFAGFEIERLSAYQAEIHEGEGHSGLSDLVELVARKPA